MLIQVVWAALDELHRGLVASITIAVSIYFLTLGYLESAGYDPFFASDYITREDYTLKAPTTYFFMETVGAKLWGCCAICVLMLVFARRQREMSARRDATEQRRRGNKAHDADMNMSMLPKHFGIPFLVIVLVSGYAIVLCLPERRAFSIIHEQLHAMREHDVWQHALLLLNRGRAYAASVPNKRVTALGVVTTWQVCALEWFFTIRRTKQAYAAQSAAAKRGERRRAREMRFVLTFLVVGALTLGPLVRVWATTGDLAATVRWFFLHRSYFWVPVAAVMAGCIRALRRDPSLYTVRSVSCAVHAALAFGHAFHDSKYGRRCRVLDWQFEGWEFPMGYLMLRAATAFYFLSRSCAANAYGFVRWCITTVMVMATRERMTIDERLTILFLSGLFLAVRAVSALLDRADAMEARAEDLERLIDTANAPIIGVDVDGRVNEWNQTAAKISGFTKAETKGKLLSEVACIAPEDRAGVQTVVTKALGGEETTNYEVPLRTKGGAKKTLLLNASARRSATGVVTGVVGLGQNITRWRRRYLLKTIPEAEPTPADSHASGSVSTAASAKTAGAGSAPAVDGAATAGQGAQGDVDVDQHAGDDSASAGSDDEPPNEEEVEERIKHELEGLFEDDADESWEAVERRFRDQTGLALDSITS